METHRSLFLPMIEDLSGMPVISCVTLILPYFTSFNEVKLAKNISKEVEDDFIHQSLPSFSPHKFSDLSHSARSRLVTAPKMNLPIPYSFLEKVSPHRKVVAGIPFRGRLLQSGKLTKIIPTSQQLPVRQ